MVDSAIDLFNVILNSNRYNAEETILDINTILEVLNHKHYFYKDLYRLLECYGDGHKRCIYCGKELKQYVYIEDNNEEFYNYYCDNSNCHKNNI